MNEDAKLNAYVKAALEEGAGVTREELAALETLAAGARRRPDSRARRLRAHVPWLIAASCLACLGLAALFSPKGVRGRSAEPVTSVIALFMEVEGSGLEVSETTPEEVLLAWQEAPCADLL